MRRSSLARLLASLALLSGCAGPRAWHEAKVEALVPALSEVDPTARAWAAIGLGLRASDAADDERASALEALRAALRDPAPRVRGEAALSLCQWGLRGGVDPARDLFALAAGDPDPAVRARAWKALEWLGERGRALLLERGLSHPRPRVRRSTLRVLTTLDARPATTRAIAGRLRDDDADVRIAAAHALAALGPAARAHAPALAACADLDAGADPAALAEAAVAALAEVGVAPPARSDVLATLWRLAAPPRALERGLLELRPPRTRRLAAATLVALGSRDPRLFAPLLAALDDAWRDPDVALAAVDALGRLLAR